MIKTLAIDDEPLALQQLAAYIKRIPFLELVAECHSANEAKRILEEEMAQGGLSVAGRCRCLTKDSNTSIEKEGYIPYSLQA